MRSSYLKNNYQEVFQAIISAFKPQLCVELGVLDGYSTIGIGSGLSKNGIGHLHAYDLFDDYKYNHGNREDVQRSLKDLGLENIIELHQADAKYVHLHYEDCSVSLLHVDISNTGDTVAQIMRDWDPKMVHGGIILFEGGTTERDQVEWMIKYNAKPIKPELENNQIIKDKYIFATYLKFPGLTMLLKKR